MDLFSAMTYQSDKPDVASGHFTKAGWKSIRPGHEKR